ncbi:MULTISPECIES: hypothetical protein [Rossellomorea]|uniref:hypothetical protein n=1 Tax=Rossellomorea TaxID=2837508 RepID=UPI001CCC01C7|nr:MULTISPECIES: hypothetical protein [Rossellomorea]MCA0147241.1 hypothetical protein [Rossellomorea vietnamensis]WGG44571.1 hypothetical protein P8596_17630 [Rossellomorea sp. DA94]
MNLRIYRIIHLIITGIITIPITLFLASGGLGENYTGHTFVYPDFLSIIGVWLIGSVLSFIRKSAVFGLVISALPALFFMLNVLITFIT